MTVSPTARQRPPAGSPRSPSSSRSSQTSGRGSPLRCAGTSLSYISLGVMHGRIELTLSCGGCAQDIWFLNDLGVVVGESVSSRR